MIEAEIKGFYMKSFTRFGRRPQTLKYPPSLQQVRRGQGEPYQGVPPYFFNRLRGTLSKGSPYFSS